MRPGVAGEKPGREGDAEENDDGLDNLGRRHVKGGDPGDERLHPQLRGQDERELSRDAKQVGEGRSESTPVETALPTGTTTVPAKRVVEAGSPTLKERAASAASE
jgi:hypothetical protein